VNVCLKGRSIFWSDLFGLKTLPKMEVLKVGERLMNVPKQSSYKVIDKL